MRRDKPAADFTNGDLGTLGVQSLLNIGDYLSASPSRELQHGFAIGLLEIFELFFVLLADIQVCLTGWLQLVLNKERLRIARPVFKLLLRRYDKTSNTSLQSDEHSFCHPIQHRALLETETLPPLAVATRLLKQDASG